MAKPKKTAQVKCPQCKKASVWSQDNEFRPFCSKRCRLIDLGAWAGEEYQIAAQPSLDDYDDFSTGMGADEKPFTPTMH